MTKLGVTEKVLFGVTIIIVLITAATVNLLVCFVVYRNRLLRQQFSSVFIVNLAVCDFLMATLAMPFSLGAVVASKWPFGHATCLLTGFANQVLGISAILTLAMISIDRFYAVIKPLKYRAKMSMQKATWSIAYVWFQALTFSAIPTLCRWYIFNDYYYFCTFSSSFRTRTESAFAASLYVVNFVLPLLVMLVAYYKIFKVARQHSQRIAPAIFTLGTFGTVKLPNLRQEMGRQREAKAARKIMIVIAAFLCCNAPYTVMRIVELATTRTLHVPRYVTIAAKWINFLKSTLNPVIYGLLQRRFRAALASVFRSRLRRHGHKTSFLHFSNRNRKTHHDRLQAGMQAAANGQRDTAPRSPVNRTDKKFWFF